MLRLIQLVGFLTITFTLFVEIIIPLILTLAGKEIRYFWFTRGLWRSWFPPERQLDDDMLDRLDDIMNQDDDEDLPRR